MTAPTIVFDLDGTLVDTAPDLVGTLNVILGREGLPPVGYEAARNMVGGGARRMIERGLDAERVRFDPPKVDALFRDFIVHYEEHIADHSRIFPGVEAALDQLAANGCRFAVCTNKLEALSVRLLGLLGLAPRFAAICGADTFAVYKPNPDHLLQTIARAGGSFEQAVMVGDSATDVSVAHAARVPVVAVDFGYTDVPVESLGPDRVISHYRELPGAVFDLLGAKN